MLQKASLWLLLLGTLQSAYAAPATERLTNGQRVQKGLPLEKPRRLYNATRTNVLRPRASTDPAQVQSGVVQIVSPSQRKRSTFPGLTSGYLKYDAQSGEWIVDSTTDTICSWTYRPGNNDFQELVCTSDSLKSVDGANAVRYLAMGFDGDGDTFTDASSTNVLAMRYSEDSSPRPYPMEQGSAGGKGTDCWVNPSINAPLTVHWTSPQKEVFTPNFYVTFPKDKTELIAALSDSAATGSGLYGQNGAVKVTLRLVDPPVIEQQTGVLKISQVLKRKRGSFPGLTSGYLRLDVPNYRWVVDDVTDTTCTWTYRSDGNDFQTIECQNKALIDKYNDPTKVVYLSMGFDGEGEDFASTSSTDIIEMVFTEYGSTRPYPLDNGSGGGYGTDIWVNPSLNGQLGFHWTSASNSFVSSPSFYVAYSGGRTVFFGALSDSAASSTQVAQANGAVAVTLSLVPPEIHTCGRELGSRCGG